MLRSPLITPMLTFLLDVILGLIGWLGSNRWLLLDRWFQDARPPFDIHEYGQQTLDKLSQDADVGNAMTFIDVMRGLRRVSLPHHSYPSLKTQLAEPPVEEKKEDPFLNIAPKKPNWDLRRDLQKELDKLVKRTQKALYQLMDIITAIHLKDL
nr:hypothetical protein [Tanacetum cinerariifolium]